MERMTGLSLGVLKKKGQTGEFRGFLLYEYSWSYEYQWYDPVLQTNYNVQMNQ